MSDTSSPQQQPPQQPQPGEGAPAAGSGLRTQWQEWTQAPTVPPAAAAAAVVGAAALLAVGDDGDGLADGTLADDVLGVDDDGMTDEERAELNDKIVADGAAYAATQAQWDTFNNLDWS
jgi:hypothetical protein